MNYKIYLYIIFTLISCFGISAINFDNFVRKNKYWETRVLVICLSFALGYLLTNFVIDFLNI